AVAKEIATSVSMMMMAHGTSLVCRSAYYVRVTGQLKSIAGRVAAGHTPRHSQMSARVGGPIQKKRHFVGLLGHVVPFLQEGNSRIHRTLQHAQVARFRRSRRFCG